MKKFYLFLMLSILAVFSQSRSYGQMLLHESFSYTLPATIGGNGATGTSANNWTTHSVTTGQTTTDTLYPGSLNYTGLVASTGEKLHLFSYKNSISRDVNSVLPTNTNTVMYYSVLINVIDSSQISSTVFDYFMSFGATSGSSVLSLGGRLGIKGVNTNKANFRLGIGNISGGTPTYTELAQDLNYGTTYLVVVKYDRSAGTTVAGLWVDPVATSFGGTEPAGSVTNASGTNTFAAFASICIRNTSTTPKVEIDEIRVGSTWADVTPAAASTPTLTVAPTTLTGFTYVAGSGPSTSQSYVLSGSNLTGAPGNIAVTAPADYEVSLDNTTFSASVNVSYTTATLASTTVSARLKSGLAAAAYNSEIITNTGGGATTANVTCSGDVTIAPTPTLIATPSTLTGFTYVATSGGPSVSQSYDISGSDLTGAPGNITVTAPTDYEVSLDNITFFANVNVPYTTATLAATTVHVRLITGLAVATYNLETIANAGGGAAAVNVTCSGVVTAVAPPILTATPITLTGFTYVVGFGPSTSQSYDLSGTDLTGAPGDIVITAPADYEVSLDNATFTATVNVAFTSATLAATTVHVRLIAGLPVAAYNSEAITNVGGGAATANVTCSGDVTAPTLTATPTTLTGFIYVVGSGPSVSQSYDLSGVNLTGAPGSITVTAPTDYEVSLDNATFTATVNIPYNSATLTATTIHVRLIAGLAIAAYNSEIITNAGGGATTAEVTCSGLVTDIVIPPCLSEDFINFATGTHASPGTIDLATKLDSLTHVPGWTGLKVFNAGGEIKIGNSSVAGYIITPAIDISAGDAASLSFDVQQFGTDVNVARVYLATDGVTFTQIDSVVPTATYTTHTTLITGGTATSKIKIGMSAKRSYLDNIAVTCGIITSVSENNVEVSTSIYPNPANDQVTVSNIPTGVIEISIFDVTGNQVSSTSVNNRTSLNIDLGSLPKGVYLLNMIDENKTTSVHKIIKL